NAGLRIHMGMWDSLQARNRRYADRTVFIYIYKVGPWFLEGSPAATKGTGGYSGAHSDFKQSAEGVFGGWPNTYYRPASTAWRDDSRWDGWRSTRGSENRC